MPQRTVVGLAWTGILLVALFLRFHDLGKRPMHFDEATGARFVAQHMEESGYQFNPEHFHGPIQSALAVRLSKLRRQSSWRALDAGTLRLIPAVAGILLVLAPLLWTRQLGQTGALAAGALLATSPLLVYYNRMFIHESLLALLAVLSLTALLRLTRQPSLFMALLSGILIGLMWATKETFVITLFSWVAAALLIHAGKLRKMELDGVRQNSKTYLAHILVATAGMILTTGYMYTDGLRNAGGLLDPIRTFFMYETVPGHAKGLLYYAHQMIWPKWQAGVLWWEGPVLLLAVIFLIPGFRNSRQTEQFRLCAFLAMATALQLFIYSLIPYKTPWLMVGPWAHACLLAGASIGLISEKAMRLRIILPAALLMILGLQTYQSVQAIGRFDSDTRNPYAYVPTQKDIGATTDWLTALEDSIAPDDLGTLGVLGTQYWPLPWYLREFESIGYWQEADSALQKLTVIFAMPDQFEAADKLLSKTHIALPRGLREDAPMMLYVRQDIWNQWMEDTP